VERLIYFKNDNSKVTSNATILPI